MVYDEESRIAEFYDGDYAALRTSSGDVAFYVEEAVRSRGPVLELGCGSGRILVPTARAGVEVVGVDSSATMLDRARRNLEAEREDVRRRASFREGDFRDVALGRAFALVTIPFRPIAHVVDVDGQLALFRNVRRHLAPGGRLVFDFFHPNLRLLAEPKPERLDVERVDGRRVVRRYSSNVPRPATQVLETRFRWEVLEEGRVVDQASTSFPMRWYHRFELEHLLARCGLRVTALHGGFGRAPLEDASPEMVFECRAAPGPPER